MKNTTKYRGVVEGFFGTPLRGWTWSERYKTIKFIKAYAPSIDSFFYCPKDDPYVTGKWNYLYPQRELKELAKFINYCNKCDIKFIYGFNPDIGINLDWVEPTIKKIKQLISIGTKSISLVFDDIPLAYDVIDNYLTEASYKNYIDGINKIYSFYDNVLTEFWVCSPDYFFNKETALTKSVMKLNNNIGIIWSGPEIFVKSINKNDISKLDNVLGGNRKVILWFNYPVNDCEQNVNTFNLGAFPKVDTSITRRLTGIFVNPMRECYSNLPFYITFSKYLSKPKAYKRSTSWKQALQTLLETENSLIYQNIICSFSSPNKLDTKRKYIVALEKPSMELNLNPYGTLFLDSIKNVFTDFENYVQLVDRISKSLDVSLSSFKKFDWFPTNTKVSRYLTEISRVLEARYDLYKSYTSLKVSFRELNKLVEESKSKYSGRLILTISKGDEKKYLKGIVDYVSRERESFVKLINSNRISRAKKIELVLARKGINRFTAT